MEFTTATLRAALEGPTGRTTPDGKPIRRSERTVNTIMSSVHTHFKRVTGDRGNSLGDLTWITVESLSGTSQLPDIRPVMEDAQHPNAVDGATEALSLTSQRKLVENLRQALAAASRAVRASNLTDAQQRALIRQYDTTFTGLGEIADDMKRALRRIELTRERSTRQEKSWVDWDQLLSVSGPLFQEFLDTVQDPTVANMPSKWKRMQNILLLALHTAIPPGRNDFAGLRFVAGTPDPVSLRDSRSPNYVNVGADGSMTLVLNAYKTDRKTLSDQYDAASGDFLIDHERTLRRELKGDPVLAKYGFRPRLVAEMLTLYRRASFTAFGPARNPHEYIFYDWTGDDTVVKAVKEDALSKRLGRLMKSVTGKAPTAQLFRPMFVTWFGNQRPSMREREHFADWMAHTVERQLESYDKRGAAGEPEVGAKRQRTLLREDEQ